MNIGIFGSGYVGLVAAVCFAEVGHQVVCADIDEKRINQLQQGICPIFEPGLKSLLIENIKNKRLQFTTQSAEAVKHGVCLFIAVGTPSDETGNADLRYVFQVAETIAEHMDDYKVIVDKSTVPIGTADKVDEIVQKILSERHKTIDYDVVSNPEFLREGVALEDFRYPDRIIIGADNPRAQALLRELYAPFDPKQNRIIEMDRRSAELTKYACNAMLATKISFINEMANLAEKIGADIDYIRKGMGTDPRIGHHFINPGCGYGGSCFGKDIKALIHTAQSVGSEANVIQAVESVNVAQKKRIFEKIENFYQGNLSGKVFAVWGLSFKPQTDDMRDAPSIEVIRALLDKGAIIQAFDPVAISAAQKILPQHPALHFSLTSEDALEGANALILLTEWDVFKNPDFRLIHKTLTDSVIFDGRNIYDPVKMRDMGIQYYGIGRGLRLNNKINQEFVELHDCV